MVRSDISTTEAALCQELDEIEARKRLRSRGTANPLAQDDLETLEQRAARLKLTALCLSGGGIRSASFCLGVLQALASKHLLDRFDYLSTVSGGGFIGGWLQMLIRDSGSVRAAEDAITRPRPAALRRLRAYTNYLTPQTGPLSADTWAGIVLYLRNLLINWLTFAPMFLLVALAPIVYRTAISVAASAITGELVLLAGAALLLLISVVSACMMLPSHRRQEGERDVGAYATAGQIRWLIVSLAVAWAVLAPALLDFAAGDPDHAAAAETAAMQRRVVWAVPLTYLVVMIAGYWSGWAWQALRADRALPLFRVNFARWIIASVGTALLMWVMMHAALSMLPLQVGSKSRCWWTPPPC